MVLISLVSKANAGKGTQLNLLSSTIGKKFAVTSVGDQLRKEVAEQTPLGKQAHSYMQKGELVPDSLIIELVMNKIKNSHEELHFLDGFPRTVPQANALIGAGVHLDENIQFKVIELYVSDEEALKRAENRWVCPDCGKSYSITGIYKPEVEGHCSCGAPLKKREDDKTEVVQKRLKDYELKTYPVLDVFKAAGIPVFTIDNTDAKNSHQEFVNVVTHK